MRLDVIGLGEVCIDWVAFVERFPEPDEKIYSLRMEKFPGGVIANFCVGAARLGLRVGFMGGVGRDPEGECLLKNFQENGVDYSHTKVRGDRGSAVNMLVVNREGQKTAVIDPNLYNNALDPDELDEEYIASSRCIHTSAIKPRTAEEAFRIAGRRGVVTSVDLEKQVVETDPETVRRILSMTNILIPNKMGARRFTGKEDLVEAGRTLLSYGPEVVVITVGEDGAIVITREAVERVPAYRVKAVDATGAGDAFAAGFIYGYVVRGWDPYKSARMGNAVAAIKCLSPGAQTGLPTIDKVKEFLGERGEDLGI